MWFCRDMSRHHVRLLLGSRITRWVVSVGPLLFTQQHSVALSWVHRVSLWQPITSHVLHPWWRCDGLSQRFYLVSEVEQKPSTGLRFLNLLSAAALCCSCFQGYRCTWLVHCLHPFVYLFDTLYLSPFLSSGCWMNLMHLLLPLLRYYNIYVDCQALQPNAVAHNLWVECCAWGSAVLMGCDAYAAALARCLCLELCLCLSCKCNVEVSWWNLVEWGANAGLLPLLQCLTSVCTGERQCSPTSLTTSSDTTIKKQWKLGSEYDSFSACCPAVLWSLCVCVRVCVVSGQWEHLLPPTEQQALIYWPSGQQMLNLFEGPLSSRLTFSPFDSTGNVPWWHCRMSRPTWMRREARLPWGHLKQLVCAIKCDLICVWISCCLQVFDATNTTRERRELILNFVKDNAFKVRGVFIVTSYNNMFTSVGC